MIATSQIFLLMVYLNAAYLTLLTPNYTKLLNVSLCHVSCVGHEGSVYRFPHIMFLVNRPSGSVSGISLRLGHWLMIETVE